MNSTDPQLSGIRTFLFWALALVWFTEMLFMGLPSFSRVWTHLWQVTSPEDPLLLTTLYTTWATAAPAKGALFVLAVFGLRSRNPTVRTALFASMSLVPPLNIAFPFRQQGFLPGPVTVAAVLSSILWGSFFLFREPARERTRGGGQSPPSRWEIIQYGWFAVNSAAITLMALFLLFWPRTALNLIFPCSSSLLSAHEGGLASLIHTTLATGTHLLAVATASWIATVNCRTNPALRRALTVASTVHAGLFLVFPLRQIFLESGESCATSSILVVSVPLLVGWVLYAAVSNRVRPARTAPLHA